jgi:hypothetical protein
MGMNLSMNMTTVVRRSLVVLILLLSARLNAADAAPLGPWELTPAEIAKGLKTASRVEPGKDGAPERLVLGEAINYERYSLQQHLAQGWYRLTFKLAPDRAARSTESLQFSLWNPHGSPGAFRFTTPVTPAEFGAGGKPVEVTRTLHVGPDNGNIGMLLRGGWKGLALSGLRFEPLRDVAFLESIRADRLLYATTEKGRATVRLLNGGKQPVVLHLTVELEAGLGDPVAIHDADVTVPPTAGSSAHVVTIDFPPQREYGHQLRAVLRRPGKDGEILGDVRDWFYVSDRPVRIGHLAAWGSDNDYEANPEQIAGFVGRMRNNRFPFAEMTFWAPDDFGLLVPPAGKTRWWSGQTLARLSEATIKARILALHDQGMKAISYTDLRLDFGFRVSELFRLHPDWCNWDANDVTMGWSGGEIARQLREDDAERFDPKEPNKPRFGARGVWGPQTGNPAVVDYHIGQLVASAKYFGWDGFRYDDPYDYDFSGADLLGRKVPFTGFFAPVLLARLRGALEKANPGIIYGHNMEWVQKEPSAAGVPGTGGNVETAMPLDTPPEENDYYTEHLRDDGLHLQERATAYWGDGTNWEMIAGDLQRLGHNAARRGGHAYAITKAHDFAIEGRTFTALMLASRVHLAYWASDWQRPYLCLAARHCDLLYGETLRPAPEDALRLEAKGGREVWWRRYVRVLEPEPGHRIYLVHLINPPEKPGIDSKNQNPPPTATDLRLTWQLPKGWTAERAWEITADRGEGRDMSGAPSAVPVRHPLPLRGSGSAPSLDSIDVIQWSIVAVECAGPKNDYLPEWRFKLPPRPSQPAQFATEPVAADYTPNGFRPFVLAADHPLWKSQAARVDDPTCAVRKALQVKPPLNTEAYFSGIQGGRYRFALRVKVPAAPPAGAKLHLRVWPNGRVWTVDQDLPLTELKPGTWTDLTIEADIGSDRGNCGVQVIGGWDGLLIDRLEIRALKSWSEAERLADQKQRAWPQDLVPAKDGGAWCQLGLWHEFLGIESALKACQVPVTACDWYVFRAERNWNGPRLDKPEVLAQYRLVVLANTDLRTFSLEQRAWLKGWVEAGGALLMTGGPYAFGRGWWQESDLIASILPATLKPFDLRPLGAGKPLPLKGVGPLAGLKLPANAAANWLHELEPKPGATVALTADGRPALVLGEVGKGRVALLALAPLGEDIPGAWWRSDAGKQITEAACRWLLRKSAP